MGKGACSPSLVTWVWCPIPHGRVEGKYNSIKLSFDLYMCAKWILTHIQIFFKIRKIQFGLKFFKRITKQQKENMRRQKLKHFNKFTFTWYHQILYMYKTKHKKNFKGKISRPKWTKSKRGIIKKSVCFLLQKMEEKAVSTSGNLHQVASLPVSPYFTVVTFNISWPWWSGYTLWLLNLKLQECSL